MKPDSIGCQHSASYIKRRLAMYTNSYKSNLARSPATITHYALLTTHHLFNSLLDKRIFILYDRCINNPLVK